LTPDEYKAKLEREEVALIIWTSTKTW
jgi:hypothetical protein